MTIAKCTRYLYRYLLGISLMSSWMGGLIPFADAFIASTALSASTMMQVPRSIRVQDQSWGLHASLQDFISLHYPLSVVATGITWPPRISRGTATLPLAIASNLALADVYPYATLYGVEVTVGTLPMQLVVDTGASNSVLSEAIAQDLELASTPVPRERVESFVVGEDCSQQQLNFYQLPPITAGQATVEGISALGLPFSTNPTQTPGVLGMDVLSAFDVVIDGEAEKLHLQVPTAPDPEAIPLTGRIGLMTATIQINEQGSFPFMLDTGAALTVLSQNLVNRIDLDMRAAQPVEVIGFCGTEMGQYLRVASVALADYRVQQLDVIILNNPVLEALGVEGILGQNFLNRYRQHWRFGEPDADGFPSTGSLELSPIESFD